MKMQRVSIETLDKMILSMGESLMSYKMKAFWAFISFMVLVVIGCANNYDFDEEELDIRLNFDTACIDKLAPFFNDYFEERTSHKDIQDNIKCMVEAVDYVKFRVTGQSQERYSLNEIKSFFNQFVFQDNPKGDSFYTNILRIKKELISGSERYLTFNELERVQDILLQAEPVMIRLSSLAKEAVGSESFQSNSDIELVTVYAFELLKDILLPSTHTTSLESLLEVLTVELELGESAIEWLKVFNLLIFY